VSGLGYPTLFASGRFPAEKVKLQGDEEGSIESQEGIKKKKIFPLKYEGDLRPSNRKGVEHQNCHHHDVTMTQAHNMGCPKG
jgi:hypothetical protein